MKNMIKKTKPAKRDLTKRSRAEQSLRSSELRYRRLFETAQDGILILDAQTGAITDVNPYLIALLGYLREEFVGKKLWEVGAFKDIQASKDAFEALQRNEYIRYENLPLKTKDGRLIQVEFVSNVYRVGDEKVIQCNVRDITEHKRLVAALQENEKKYRTLVTSSPDGIFLIDLSGNFISVNQAMCGELGFSETELRSMNIWDIVPDQYLDEYRTRLTKILNGESLIEPSEYAVRGKDGKIIYIEVLSVPFYSEKGVIGFQGIARALTTRKQAEDALRERERQMGALVTSLDDIVFVVDEHGTYRQVWTSNEKLLAMPRSQLVGKNLVDIWGEELGGLLLSAVQRVLGSGNAETYEFPLEIHQRTLWSMARASPILVPGETPKSVVVLVRDITERKRAEDEIKQRAEQLALLYDAGLTINRTLDPRVQLELLCTITAKALHADNTSFFRYDAARNDLGFEFGAGLIHELEILRDERFPLGAERGLIGWVAQSRVPLNLPDVTTDPRWIATDTAIRSALWVPVLHDEQLLGVLSATSTRVNAFTSQDERLFVLFANQVAVAMENARLFTTEQARSKEVATLYDLSRVLADTDDFDNILSLAVRLLIESCHVTFARALLVEGDEFVVRAAFPIRALPHELQIGHHESVAALSFCQHALAQSDPIIVRTTDSVLTDLEREFLFLDMAQLLYLVPFRVGETQQGMWILAEARKEEREPFTAEKLRLIGSISEQVTGALQRANLREQTTRQLDRLEALHSIDTAISASMDLHLTLNILLEHVKTQLNVDATDVLLLNPHSQTLEYAAGRGFRTRSAETALIRLGDNFAGRVALERRTVRVDEPAQVQKTSHFAALWAGEDFAAYYGVPLISKGQVKGVLEVYHRAPFQPELDWISFLETLAGQAAIAIDSAQLFENLQRSNADLERAYDATIEGWSHALDLRDKETEGHTQRVTETTLRLARAMGIDNAELVHIRRGGLLHDIGKMGVSDSVLLKPGKLTDEEWVQMRNHPEFAFKMLSPIAYLKPALDIPYCHHEKWDGTGYPRGLKGDQIPLVARIFAIVDVWDALTSDRVYRPAWSREKTSEYIRALSGTHFDPNVVPAFLRLMEQPVHDQRE